MDTKSAMKNETLGERKLREYLARRPWHRRLNSYIYWIGWRILFFVAPEYAKRRINAEVEKGLLKI